MPTSNQKSDAINAAFSSIRLESLVNSLQGGVLVEDQNRRVVLTNQAFCTLFDIPLQPADLVGMDCLHMLKQAKILFAEPETFTQGIENLLCTQQMVQNEALPLVDGRVLLRDYMPVMGSGGALGYLWHYRDGTLEKQFQQRSERLLNLETTNKAIMRMFLQPENINASLNQALGLLGEAVDVSRAYLFRIRDNERLLDNTHEWCAPGVHPEIQNLQGLPLDEIFPSLFPLLVEQDLIAPAHISELPPDLRGVLEPQHVETILWVPLVIGGRITGFFGYDETRRARHWLPEEITAARILAEAYTHALEREQAHQLLIAARDEALRTAQLRSQFVANMSHEIRTPLTGIMGMMELLLETELTEDQREFASESLSSGERLLRIVNDVLDFSKLEAGQIVLDADPVDIRAIATEVRLTLTPQVQAKPLEFRVVINDNVPYRIYGDAARLHQVLINLTANAVKFTQQGCVTLTIEQVAAAGDSTRLSFSVEDTGIGIAPDKLALIFESFVQADGSVTRKYGGTGLGLSITQQLVALMGGEIKVESTVGKGSLFHFVLTLPVAQSTSLTKSGLPMLKPLNILIIDPNKTARYILAHQLTSWSMHVSQFNSVQEYLRSQTRPMRYDLLFIRLGISSAEIAALAMLVRRVVLIAEGDASEIKSTYPVLSWPIDQSQLYNLLVPELEAPPIKPPTGNTSGRILIVDDYANNVMLVQFALNSLPVQVDHLDDGAQLMAWLDAESYDMILMDMQMPVINGMELTRAIRSSNKPYRTIPIVAFTASLMREQRQEYLENGINDILGKPFSVTDLRAIVERWTGLTPVDPDSKKGI